MISRAEALARCVVSNKRAIEKGRYETDGSGELQYEIETYKFVSPVERHPYSNTVFFESFA